MKKNLLSTLFLFILGTISYAQTKTTIKGTVLNWPTDTIYIQTMPFNSPHSSELKFQTIKKDSVFNFSFISDEKPTVVQIYTNKKHAENNKEQLLFLNYTDKYYYSHCDKFYTHGVTTFLLEPNKTLEVVLKHNQHEKKLSNKVAEKYKKIGIEVSPNNTVNTVNKTTIDFIGDTNFQNEYYQTYFNVDDKIDNRLKIYETEPIEKAISSYHKITTKLIGKLELEKNKLSPVFYDYLKAEIEFGARKEFLKFLMLTKEKEMDTFFSKEIPEEISNIIEFDRSKINSTVILSEEYNKFLMLYLNFKLNITNKKYNSHYSFSIQKGKIIFKKFPRISVFYFMQNYLLFTNKEQLLKDLKSEDDAEGLINSVVKNAPDKVLKEKLIKKYDL